MSRCSFIAMNLCKSGANVMGGTAVVNGMRDGLRCSLTLDRDHNAAINILTLGLQSIGR